MRRLNLLLLLPLLRKRRRKEIGGKSQMTPSIMTILKHSLRRMSLKSKKKARYNNSKKRRHKKRNLKSLSVFKSKKTAVKRKSSQCVWLS